MKNHRLLLTTFAFMFAIIGALASSMNVTGYTTGSPSWDCSTAYYLSSARCYANGWGPQCTIMGEGWHDAWVTGTDCLVPLRSWEQ